MLVITRKHGETIRIGDDVEIVVTQVNRGKIRLGIAAPPEINIRRGELTRRCGQDSASETRRRPH
jgi:carbon storage regulator